MAYTGDSTALQVAEVNACTSTLLWERTVQLSRRTAALNGETISPLRSDRQIILTYYFAEVAPIQTELLRTSLTDCSPMSRQPFEAVGKNL